MAGTVRRARRSRRPDPSALSHTWRACARKASGVPPRGADALLPHRRSAGRDPPHSPVSIAGRPVRKDNANASAQPSMSRRRRLMERGVVLIDVRETDEHARERIAGRPSPSAVRSRRSSAPVGTGRSDLPLPVRRTHRRPMRRGWPPHPARGLCPRGRHRGLEDGWASGRADRASPSRSCVRSRSPRAASFLWVLLASGVTGLPRFVRFRRRRPCVCRDQRLVRDGEPAGHHAVERPVRAVAA